MAALLPDGGPHPGGINAVLGDGSVKFVKFTVSPSTFRKLAVIDEADEDLGDYGYRHLLCRLEG